MKAAAGYKKGFAADGLLPTGEDWHPQPGKAWQGQF
jgi:hypothetical protein